MSLMFPALTGGPGRDRVAVWATPTPTPDTAVARVGAALRVGKVLKRELA